MHIIIDTREKKPWFFSGVETTRAKLDTGDYSLAGLEDKLCIERKQNVSELAENVCQARFEKELKRMEEIPHSFLILEFSIDDIMAYPQGSNVPKRMWSKLKTKGPFIMRRISELCIEHDVNVIFAGDVDNAAMFSMKLMKRITEKYGTDS